MYRAIHERDFDILQRPRCAVCDSGMPHVSATAGVANVPAENPKHN